MIAGLALSGVTVLCVASAIAYLVALPFSVGDDDAERLIRHYLRYRASERYVELYRARAIDAQAARGYQAALAAIDGLRFESVEVGRLLPDYLLSDDWPTYYAMAVSAMLRIEHRRGISISARVGWWSASRRGWSGSSSCEPCPPVSVLGDEEGEGWRNLRPPTGTR